MGRNKVNWLLARASETTQIMTFRPRWASSGGHQEPSAGALGPVYI